MKIIKRILFKLLGVETYLYVISNAFFFLYRYGFLRRNSTFYCHYFVEKLIKKGDHIIDIGANLGYYTVLFSRLTGKEGKVYSVEPVTVFRRILNKHIRKLKNVKVIPYALGSKNDETVKMGIPQTSKYYSHGRTRIVNNSSNSNFTAEFEEKMFKPSFVFKDLRKLDYIKCDIEGYEIVVIPEMLPMITRFLPIIQIETGGDNKKKIMDVLSEIGYRAYYVSSTLIEINNIEQKTSGDLIFIPENKRSEVGLT